MTRRSSKPHKSYKRTPWLYGQTTCTSQITTKKFTSNITTTITCLGDHNQMSRRPQIHRHYPIIGSQCIQGREKVSHQGGGDVGVDVVEDGGWGSCSLPLARKCRRPRLAHGTSRSTPGSRSGAPIQRQGGMLAVERQQETARARRRAQATKLGLALGTVGAGARGGGGGGRIRCRGSNGRPGCGQRRDVADTVPNRPEARRRRHRAESARGG
jgi:hypothetical protein